METGLKTEGAVHESSGRSTWGESLTRQTWLLILSFASPSAEVSTALEVFDVKQTIKSDIHPIFTTSLC